jgi:sporulation protein YlmC with PRC-barrel domain
LINFEKIIGLKVITSDAHTLGEVKGARVDPKTWTIGFLNVKLADNAANRLGMKKRFGSPTISIPVSMVQAVSEHVTIAKSLEQLEHAKEIVEYKD